MSILSWFFNGSFLSRTTMTPHQKRAQEVFRREDDAAVEWERRYDRAGQSITSVAHVANHELFLSILAKYNVTRQGLINGYVRVYSKTPYFVGEDDFVGEE